MRAVKDEVRLLGVDDAPFEFEDETTELVGTVFRGGDYIEGVLVEEVEVDGFDVTEKLLKMVNESRHKDQIQAVLLDGVTFAGFNVVDLEKVAEEGEVGAIAVSRNEPDRERMDRGLDNVEKKQERKEMIDKAGEAKRHEQDEGPVFFQHSGISEEKTREVLELANVRGVLPEPVRVSHLIAAGLKSGESKGSA
ncbi:MAG: DUF99 family protein [Candidatus Nanohaloarchaeota archaeon QJJ-7]|nr:DUF99 family protein [Candidatus Nanohaloarchaeota archaeon QJJ-7]